MMSDEPNDTAVATSPDPTEEMDAAGAADAECAAPVEAVPVEAALNPADEVDQLKVPRISRVSTAFPLGEENAMEHPQQCLLNFLGEK